MTTKRMSRRQFLRMSGLAALGLSAAACAQSPTPTPAPPAKATAATTTTTAPAAAPSATPAPRQPVTIKWWTVPSEEYSEQAQRKLVDAFHAAQSAVRVDISVLPESGFTDKMTTALGSGSGAPDVAFFWNINWLPQALDLGPFIAKDNFDTSMYIKGFWDTRTQYKNTTVGLPLGVGANFVMYNQKVYDEMGVKPPDTNVTAQDWLSLAPKLTDKTKKRWGSDRPRGPFRAIWFNLGARPFSEDGKTVDGYLNGPGSVAAYTWLWDLVQSNSTPTPADLEVLGTEGTGPVDLFMAGRLANATLNQGHMLNAMKANLPFGIVREPGLAGGERWVNAWSITCSIWKGTKEPEAAWTFLKYWVGPEGQKFLMENGNLFPSIKSVLDRYPRANEPYVKAFFSLLQDRQVAAVTNNPWASAVLNAAQDVWDKVNLLSIKRDEIKAALDAVVPAAQKALNEARAKAGV